MQHIKSFHSRIPFLPSLLNHLLLPTQETPSILILAGVASSLYSIGADPQKTPFSYANRFHRNVFALPSNGLFTKNLLPYQRRCHIVLSPQELVCRAVAQQWTSALTSLFQLSSVMSIEYNLIKVIIWIYVPCLIHLAAVQESKCLTNQLLMTQLLKQ
jgi:hypothetical protein